MLVLSRRTNEAIVIHQDVRVTVVEISSHRVRLGIQAPAALRVDRLEIHERLCRSEARPLAPHSSPAVARASSKAKSGMLVLQRRVGETIVIGGDVRVTVTATRCNQVRLGIEAPLYMTVDRAEVAERREGVVHAASVPAEELDAQPDHYVAAYCL